MESLPYLRVSRIQTENGKIAELGDVDSEGNLVWRLTEASVITLYRCGVRFVIIWRGVPYELYVQTATPHSEARLRARVDGQCYSVLTLLPEFGFDREKA